MFRLFFMHMLHDCTDAIFCVSYGATHSAQIIAFGATNACRDAKFCVSTNGRLPMKHETLKRRSHRNVRSP